MKYERYSNLESAVADELYDGPESIENLAELLTLKTRQVRGVIMTMLAKGEVVEAGTRHTPFKAGRPHILYALAKSGKHG